MRYKMSAQKSKKPTRKRRESGNLSRMASTPIGHCKVKKTRAVSTSVSNLRGANHLPELNLSRVGVQSLNCSSPQSPSVNVNFLPKTAMKDSNRNDSIEVNGPISSALSSTALNSITLENFGGYRERMEKVIIRKKRMCCMGPVRISLSERFKELDKENESAENEEVVQDEETNNDTSNSCHVSSPDFDACQTPPSKRLEISCKTPLKITRPNSFKDSPNYKETYCGTPPRKRQYLSEYRPTPPKSSPQIFSSKTLSACFDEIQNNVTPPKVQTSNGCVTPVKRHPSQSATAGRWFSSRVFHSPRSSKRNKTASPMNTPSTPNTKSKKMDEEYQIEFRLPEGDVSESDDVNTTNAKRDSKDQFSESSLLKSDNLETVNSEESEDSSSKSVSRVMSQLSVSCPSDGNQTSQGPSDENQTSQGPSDENQTSQGQLNSVSVNQNAGNNCRKRRSLNVDALERPLTSLRDHELRYIQACSSTVLAASAAHEDSLSKTKKPRCESNSSDKSIPQPSGDSCSDENKCSAEKEDEKLNLDFPTYRFCFEFSKPERLEDSRFGLVFAAHNRIDRRIYCLKKSRGNGDQLSSKHNYMLSERDRPTYNEARKELYNEVAALSTIGFHENVVQYFSTWIEYDCLYIQLEFCIGGSLIDYLDRNDQKNALRKFRVLQLMGDIGSALQHVHDNGMVHMDLTPGNILIQYPVLNKLINAETEIRDVIQWRHDNIERLMNDPNERIVFKLADFGRCKNHAIPRLLEEVGDPLFMPFEVFGSIQGWLTEDVEVFKIDVFSFGLTIYRAMGGHYVRKPETDNQMSEITNFHKRLVYPPNSDKQLFRFVQKMVKLPRLRPTIDEVLNYPGVCDHSWSRNCLIKRMDQKKTVASRSSRQHK